MKEETKLRLIAARDRALDYLATHPVLRGMLIGAVIGFVVGAWIF